jgi:hypothetical protein
MERKKVSWLWIKGVRGRTCLLVCVCKIEREIEERERERESELGERKKKVYVVERMFLCAYGT